MEPAPDRHSVTGMTAAFLPALRESVDELAGLADRPVIVGIDARSARRPRRLRARTPPGAELLDTSVDIVTRDTRRRREVPSSTASTVPALATLRRTASTEARCSSVSSSAATHRSLARAHACRSCADPRPAPPDAEAPCPVAVAPAGFAASARVAAPSDVGVGFEPTPEGAEALAVAHAARRARRRHPAGDRRRPCRCRRSPSTTFATASRISRTSAASSKPGSSARWRSCPTSVPATADARVGDPAVELASASHDLDLLVCGSRGPRPAARRRCSAPSPSGCSAAPAAPS